MRQSMCTTDDLKTWTTSSLFESNAGFGKKTMFSEEIFTLFIIIDN